MILAILLIFVTLSLWITSINIVNYYCYLYDFLQKLGTSQAFLLPYSFTSLKFCQICDSCFSCGICYPVFLDNKKSSCYFSNFWWNLQTFQEPSLPNFLLRLNFCYIICYSCYSCDICYPIFFGNKKNLQVLSFAKFLDFLRSFFAFFL